MAYISYQIRAEYANGAYEDFATSGETIDDARSHAEVRIRSATGMEHTYEWRGQVVFVDRAP